MLSRVLEILECKREELVEFTRDLARLPSVTGDERAIGEFCAHRMTELGLELELSKVSSTQHNVLGWIRGSGECDSVMLTGHLDTLPPADGWSRDPYGGDLWEGKIFGNGVSNMKASDAAMVFAAHAIKESGVKSKGDLLVALVVSECASGIGTMDLMAKGIKTGKFINGEPTDLGVLTLHSGPQYIRLNIIGRTGHPGARDRGVNAATIMWRLVKRLGPMNTKIAAGGWLTYEDLPRYGGLPRYHLGSIRAGLGRKLAEVPSNTPDFCTAVFNVRVTPGWGVQSTLDDFRRLLEDMQREGPDFQFELSAYTGKPAFESPKDSTVVKAMAEAYQKVQGRKPELGGLEPFMFMGSDAGIMQTAGIRDGVVMGPGSFPASVPDEHVEVDNLISAAKIYAATVLKLWGVATE
jgi:acetylornithine deacetylase